MVVQEMSAQECRTMFAGRHVARLACAHDNQPYIVPIHVDFEGDCFYGYATLGMKIHWMRGNARVCLEFDDVTPDGRWLSVVVFGRYEELSATPEHEGARAVAERLFQRHPLWWEPASVPLEAHERRAPIVYRIRIGLVTGRRALPDRLEADAVRPSATRPGLLARMLRRFVERK
jgi:uncharacterized protein